MASETNTCRIEFLLMIRMWTPGQDSTLPIQSALMSATNADGTGMHSLQHAKLYQKYTERSVVPVN